MPFTSANGNAINRPMSVIGKALELRSQWTDGTVFRDFTSVAEALAFFVGSSQQVTDNLRKGHFPVFITANGVTKIYSWPNEGHYLDTDFVETVATSTRTYTFVLGAGGSVVTGMNVTNQLIIEKTGTISKAYINGKVGPVGADLIVDLKLNGTSVWAATPANRLKIAAGATTGTQTAFDTTAVVAGQVLSIDVVQTGSTTPGSSVTVQLIINQ